jgi:serine/threonine protein kinase/N-acetylneuraminic acid mutarotase
MVWTNFNAETSEADLFSKVEVEELKKLSEKTQSDVPASPKKESSDTRTNYIREIYSTELAYINSLSLLLNQAIPAVRQRKIISDSKIKVLISNCEEILKFHKTFIVELEKEVNSPSPKIGNVFLRHYRELTVYFEYINNYDNSSRLLEKLRKKKKEWIQFEEEMQNSTEFLFENFDSLLIKPIQRLTKYGLLLDNVKKYTSKDDPDYELVCAAMDKMSMMAERANQAKRQAEQSARAAQIKQLLVDYPASSLITNDRRYSSEHKVWIVSLKEAVEHLLIFWSDCLLVVKPVVKGITNLTVQLQFVALLPLLRLKLKELTKKEIKRRFGALENIKSEGIDLQTAACFVLLQFMSEEFVLAIPDENEFKQLKSGFNEVKRAMQEKFWSIVPEDKNTPLARQDHTLTHIGKKLYLFGGTQRSTFLDDFYAFDVERKTWEKIERNPTGVKPPPLARHSAVAIGKKLYIFGGVQVESFSNDLFVVDTETMTWEKIVTKGTVPSPRAQHSAVAVGTKMYIFGGYFFKSLTQQMEFDDVHEFDTETNVWQKIETSLPHQPPPRFGHAAAVLDKKIYIFGGKTKDEKVLSDLYAFDTQTNTWSQIIASYGFVPIARVDAKLCPLGTNFLVLFGGAHLNVFQDVFLFDLEKRAWSWCLLDAPLEPHQSHAMEIIDDTLYIFGGRVIKEGSTEKSASNDLIIVPNIKKYSIDVSTLSQQEKIEGTITQMLQFNRDKNAALPKDWGDTTKLKPFSFPITRDDPKQSSSESFWLVQKPIEFDWNGSVDSVVFDEKLDESVYGGEFWKATYTGIPPVFLTVHVLHNVAHPQTYSAFQQDFEIIKKCRHQNLVSYFGITHTNNDVWILLEPTTGLNIRDLMKLNGKPLTEVQVATVCAAVLRGLAYLHSQHIVHKGLQASSIVVTEFLEIKLRDYAITEHLTALTGKVDGDPLSWLAPEVVSDKKHSEKGDIYSLGMAVVEMLENVTPQAIVVSNVQKDSKYSSELRDFLAKCLTRNPDRRPDAVELLSHPFVRYTRGPETLRLLVETARKKRPKPQKSQYRAHSPPLTAEMSAAVANFLSQETQNIRKEMNEKYSAAISQMEKKIADLEQLVSQLRAEINPLLQKIKELEQKKQPSP